MANEKRLIDANARIRAIKNAWCSDCENYNGIKCRACWVDDAIGLIDDTPTDFDAVEVVHGRWKYYHKQNIAVCMNCSFERDLDANFGRAVSCPNCGAKMDGGNEDV
jgi:hypothetical protein